MIRKLLIPLASLFLLSGCCEYLGFCASASVHTSITSPQQTAQRSCPERTQVSQLPTIVADAQGSQPN